MNNKKYPPKVDKPTCTVNAAKKGVELRFPGKPAEAVVTLLNNNGFRFTPYGTSNKWEDPVWYRRNCDEALTFAQNLVTILNEDNKPQPTETATPKVTFGSRLEFA